MAVLTITQLKALWIDGFIPDQADYVDLFDTMESLGAGVPANLQSVLTAGGYAEFDGDNYFDFNLGTGNGDGYFDAFFNNGGQSLNAFFDNTSFSVENFVNGVGTNVLVIDGTGFRITQQTGANTINLKFATPTESGDVLIPSKAGTIALLSDVAAATLQEVLTAGNTAASSVNLVSDPAIDFNIRNTAFTNGVYMDNSGYFNLYNSSDGNRYFDIDPSVSKMFIETGSGQHNIAFSGAGAAQIREATFLPITGDIPIRVAVPATATSAGVAGSIAWDANHFYVCTATDTWVRTALATW